MRGSLQLRAGVPALPLRPVCTDGSGCASARGKNAALLEARSEQRPPLLEVAGSSCGRPIQAQRRRPGRARLLAAGLGPRAGASGPSLLISCGAPGPGPEALSSPFLATAAQWGSRRPLAVVGF
eukprot:tig00000489_g1364.t2